MVEASSNDQELVIVTGMSGAGRSTVANALEDLDWYVVDNLPPQMLKPLVELAEHAVDGLPKIAAVVDIRGRDFFAPLQEILANLREGTQVRVVFLEATDHALIKRFEQVRRPHPLQGNGTLLDGITAERDKLSDIRALSDIVIDTSDLNVHQLARMVLSYFGGVAESKISLTLMSFGFKYGAPSDADMIIDCRFLPNPYWVPELRNHTGLDEKVSDYILEQHFAKDFLEHFPKTLNPVISGYTQENKRHATIAIGCTGGKHRSVAITEKLAEMLGNREDVVVSTRHRDLGRE